MTHPIIERRRAEQKEKVELAERYVRSITLGVKVVKAWVVGSVARGDFNVWSDIDVVVVAEELPQRVLARADLFLDKPAGVNIVAYRPEEFDEELRRRNPLAVEAMTIGLQIGPAGP